MHHNQQGMYTNTLSSHASLLLSASPTIITSPLQNNSNNNPQSSPVTSSIALVRRQPSTPLLLAANNLDNDSHANSESPSNNPTIEGYINFKKPQNEMFKKLDGKIQEIVAAHSNLNKLYALNEFSSLGIGPKKPSELPGQLPRPPPCIPKVTTEQVSQSNDNSNLNDTASSTEVISFRPNTSIFNPNRIMKPSNKCASPGKIRSPSLTIDSAITKLHQKLQQRQQQQQLQQQQLKQMGPRPNNSNPDYVLKGPIPCSSTSPSNFSTPTINSAQFTLLAQKIKETLETERAANDKGGILSSEDKKKFQENLIAMLKREISAVTKSAQIRFNTTPDTKAKVMKQKSLLMKSSPQTLFNTIRRETSLLLNKREQQVGRSSLSLLSDQQTLNRQPSRDQNLSNPIRYPINKLQQTIKIIVPPIEYQQPSKQSESLGESSKESTSKKPMGGSNLSYQVIRNRLRLFQENNRIHLGRLQRSPYGPASRSSPTKAKNSQKSLDKIVDRLQAKWSTLPIDVQRSSTGDQKGTSLQQQIIYSSASLLQTSRNNPAISAPTPIPVFRTPLSATGKGGYFYSSSGASKVVNMKSKKSKRFLPFGLKIGNYLEKESPQPTTEKITKEQFAKCLNLVRSNDVSLQRHQEQLSQSEPKWRMPVGDRPLRLRRIRGERIHMPASASYRATRKVGLQ